ncbi:MAG: SRPBCC family protein [Desulfobacterales bacterium]
MLKEMTVEAEVFIRAPLALVWRVFSRLEEWGEWNTACEDCSFVTGDALEPGACFAFRVRPFVFPLRVTPRVVSCDPGREVVWEGSRLGIRAVHRWSFVEREGGVLLRSSERFRGGLLFLGRLLGVPARMHRLTETMLAGIRDRCESSLPRHPARERNR